MRRFRKAKIVATLGPSSQTFEMIEKLFLAGVDVFRQNFSHATHEVHKKIYDTIREVENKYNRPIAILGDLQGPKLRVGQFKSGKIQLIPGQKFQLDLSDTPGNENRVNLPHPEIYAALTVGADLLLDDGRIRMRVEHVDADKIVTTVTTGGPLSDRKGLNVPSVTLPISALSEKDHKDLLFALELGMDWIALSFVQRPEDIIEARTIIGDRARLIAKVEKPMALDHLSQIIDLSDAIMVARGDLGVEMSPEYVPAIQKQIIRKCREIGRPVIVATQMLESMVHSPAPTRAEASDVATAVYDGVDAVMLSAESASGAYPLEAVGMMNRIITHVEQDPLYHKMLADTHPISLASANESMAAAAREVASMIDVSAIVTFTELGGTALREARERPEAPLIALTPTLSTARLLNLVWGTHPVLSPVINTLDDMIKKGCRMVKTEKFGEPGDRIIMLAGVPFGARSGTNVMHIATIHP